MKEIKSSYKNLIEGRNPGFALIMFFVIGSMIIFLLPYLLTRECSLFANYSNTGEIGDTFGGIAGPIIALLAAVLTFFAFWVQLRANINQTNQFNKVDNDTKVDRFENKYFELIKLHRDNLAEISIANNIVSGRKAFISMFHEFKFCFHLLDTLNQLEQENNSDFIKLPDREIVNISYIVFYMGVGDNSDKLTRNIIHNQYHDILDKYLAKIKEYKQNWGSQDLTVYINKEEDTIFELKIKYKPFGGHISRLGHYFRHLFQIVKFVAEQPNDIISNKYDYIKILRAQMSDYEQLMLYYNSLSDLGNPWNAKEYMKKYKLIKNIPLPLADFGITPREKYGSYDENGKRLFEWDEVMLYFPSK